MAESNAVIRILVVDDDATCLSLVSGYLQRKNHHVIATKNPLDALCTLRMQWRSFDLILTDVHMPEMSGLDLLNHSIEEQFKIPIVLMSSDSDLAMMKQGLKDGAAHYFVKPMAFEVLERIWQFALPQNPNSSTARLPSFDNNLCSKNAPATTTTTNNNNDNDMLTNNNEVKVGSVAPNQTQKKPKLIWTTSLHSRFLEAVHKIGPERAVPKKILEYMNVPGLRRENIASHLQKYRIFLKRISTQQGNGNNWNERPLRSSFVLNEISFLTNNLQQQYQQLLAKPHKKGKGRSQNTSTSKGAPNNSRLIRETSDITTKNIENSSNENIINSENSNFHDSRLNPTKINERIGGNPTYVPSNYVGLRLDCNGELLGTLKDMTHESTINNEGMAKNTKIIGTNQQITDQVLDQGVFNNGDSSLNCNYMQEYGHNFGDYTQDGWRV